MDETIVTVNERRYNLWPLSGEIVAYRRVMGSRTKLTPCWMSSCITLFELFSPGESHTAGMPIINTICYLSDNCLQVCILVLFRKGHNGSIQFSTDYYRYTDMKLFLEGLTPYVFRHISLWQHIKTFPLWWINIMRNKHDIISLFLVQTMKDELILTIYIIFLQHTILVA